MRYSFNTYFERSLSFMSVFISIIVLIAALAVNASENLTHSKIFFALLILMQMRVSFRILSGHFFIYLGDFKLNLNSFINLISENINIDNNIVI